MMRLAIATSLICAAIVAQDTGGGAPVDPAAVRFEAWDVWIEPAGDEAIAAWQAEFVDVDGRTVLVGVEGGEHPAFAKPPYYDPKALATGRVVLAAFDTGDDLPRGRSRIARIHLQIKGSDDPDLEVRSVVVADRDGRELTARMVVEKGTER